MSTKLISYWQNKSVLVTGASSGLGWAIVEALAPYHVHFCLLSRRQEKMKALAEKLKNSGSTFWIKACDVRHREEVHTAINDFYRQNGGLDMAWINSGVATNSSFQKWNWEDIESVINTNLKGAVYTIRACLEIMVPRKRGTIIGIGSAVSMRGLPTGGIYGSTKIGLHYFMESLAVEFREIQFTTIHPGFIDVEINQGQPHRAWLMTPEKAARLMVKAVARRKKVYIYPFRMKLLYRMVRILPVSVYRWLARKVLIGKYKLNK
jgi:short-subunit dehydrogenase